jgi:hypothetical protein
MCNDLDLLLIFMIAANIYDANLWYNNLFRVVFWHFLLILQQEEYRKENGKSL